MASLASGKKLHSYVGPWLRKLQFASEQHLAHRLHARRVGAGRRWPSAWILASGDHMPEDERGTGGVEK